MSSVEVGTAYVSLVPSAKGFAAKMQSELGGEVASVGARTGEEYSTEFAAQAKKGIGHKSKGMFSGIVKGLLGFAAVEKVGEFLKESVTEAAKAQQQFAILNNSLKNVGDGSKEAYEGAEKYITALSESSGITKENLIPAYSKLVQVTGSTEKAQELLRTSMDASAGTHKSLVAVVDSMSKAYQGNVGSLGRLGVKTKDLMVNTVGIQKAQIAAKSAQLAYSKTVAAHGKTSSEASIALAKMKVANEGVAAAQKKTASTTLGFDQVLKVMNKRFKGDTASAANTAAGQMQRLSIQWADMREQVGTKLIPVVLKFGGYLMHTVIPAVKGVIGWFGKHKTATTALKVALKALLVLLVAQKLHEFGHKMSFVVTGTKAAYGGMTRLASGFRDANAAQSKFSGRMGTLGGKLRTIANAFVTGAKKAAAWAVATVKAGAKAAVAAAKGAAAWLASMARLALAYVKATAKIVAQTAATVAQKAVQLAVASATKAWAAAQWLLNAAMEANPIGLIVVALVALVAGFVLAYKKVGWFRDLVNGAFKLIGKAVSWVVGFIKAHFKLMLAVITGPVGLIVLFIIKHFGKIKAFITNAMHAVGRIIGSIWNGSLSVVKKGVSGIVNFVTGIPGKLGGLATKFLGAGKSLIGAFLNGLGKVGSTVAGFAQQVWDAVKSVINGGIDKLNGLLDFSINLGVKTVHINPPDIPHLATGGRATGGTLAVIGEGREPETVFPDSVLGGFLERMTAAATGGGVGRMSLTITNWDEGTGYIEAVADDRVSAHNHLAAQNRRAS